jgi:hypothetical protein
MKLIIKSIFFFTIFTFSSYGNEIHYNINAVKDKLEITVEFIGNSSGVTEVLIPVLANINYKHIKAKSGRSELRIVNNGENGKREMNCSNISPNVCSIFHILHKPNEEITLIYSLESLPGVMISDNNIVFESPKVFIFPYVKNAKQIVLDTSKLNYKHKKIYTGKKLTKLKNIIPNNSHILLDGIYIFSHSEIIEFFSKGNKNGVILGVNFRKIDNISSLIIDIDKIKRNNRKFMSYLLDKVLDRSDFNKINENGDIILINIGDKKNKYWAGYSNSANFITISNKTDYPKLLKRISHEDLHSFFSRGRGVSVNLGPKVKWNHFWFDEGFNDYYANLLNYRAGVISDKQYIDKINEQLEDHYKFYMYRQELISSTCGDAMSLLEEDYNFILFYNVGMIVALDMDSIFKKVSKLRLENFIKKSVQKACKNTPCNISKKIFLEELSKGAKHIGSYIDKYIINFSPIPPLQLPESIPEVRSKLSYKLYDSVPNYGFDMNKTSCTGVVYGINKKGNAYKKGLRNGMKITKFSEVNIYEKEWHISVEIEKTDLTKESIRYSPLQEGLIPYYELVE